MYPTNIVDNNVVGALPKLYPNNNPRTFPLKTMNNVTMSLHASVLLLQLGTYVLECKKA